MAGVCALSAVVGGVRVAVPDFDEGLPQRFPLGRPADFKMNTLTWLQDRDLFVVRNEEGMGAFSSRCTHLGCVPQVIPQVGAQPFDDNWQGGFFCPCHKSKFDMAGRVYKGVPAPTNLRIPPYSFIGDDSLVIGVNPEGAV